MKKFVFILFSFFFLLLMQYGTAQNKKDEGARNATKLMMGAMQLIYEGKMNEALPLMTKLTDSLKIVMATDKEANSMYLTSLNLESFLYQNTGQLSKAEQILMQLLKVYNTSAKLKDKEAYRKLLIQLSNLYVAMGRSNVSADNDGKNERTLEELIIDQYKNITYMPIKNEKQQFYAFYKKMYFGGVSLPAADSIELLQRLGTMLDPNRKPAELGSDAYVTEMMVLLFKKEIQKAQTPNISVDDYIKLLKAGKFTFSRSKDGIQITSNWDDVRRLAEIYRKAGNYVAAEALIKQAIAVNDNPGKAIDPMNGYALNAVKVSLEAMGNQNGMKSVVKMGSQSLDAGVKHEGVNIYYIQNKVLLAQLYHDTGKKLAYTLLTDTIVSLCKKTEDISNLVIMNAIAVAYTTIGRFKEAIGTYKTMTGYWKAHPNEAMLQAQLRAYKQLAETDRLIQDDHDEEATLKQAAALFKSQENYPEYRNMVIDLAKLCEKTNRLDSAERYCGSILDSYFNNIKENFNYLTEQEKIDWLNEQVSVLEFSASMLNRDRHPSDEFVRQTYNQQLQLKGLVLNDAEKVYNAIRKNGTPRVRQLFSQWQSNRSAIAWQYTQPLTTKVTHLIDSLNTVARTEEKEINQLSGELNQLHKNEQIDFAQIQQNLKPGEAAIEFVRFKYYNKTWTDSVCYGAFITRTGELAPHFVPLFEERQLIEMLKGDIASRDFVERFYGKGKEDADAGGSKLYKLVFSPLEQFLKGADRIHIAPTGLLNNISFKALRAKGACLADMYQDIRFYSSTREIGEVKRPSNGPQNTSIALYGGIKYGTADNTIPDKEKTKYTGRVWTSLNTWAEVSRIDSLFKAHNLSSSMVVNYNATEESLKQLSGNSPDILHIATHGFSAPITGENKFGYSIQRGTQFKMANDPMFRNGLIMANANQVWSGGLPTEGKDDGILTAYEIADLDLSKTKLVVLSACGTALGDIKGTEGVFGLQRAFKLAGVQNMLLSLWNLPDAETVQFINAFYTNKIGKKMTDHQALKAVQDEFRKTSPPYYWAGFVLIE